MGRTHKADFKMKYAKSKEYFKNHWNEFADLIKSNKYSQRQLSEMLSISRPTLRVKTQMVISTKKERHC